MFSLNSNSKRRSVDIPVRPLAKTHQLHLQRPSIYPHHQDCKAEDIPILFILIRCLGPDRFLSRPAQVLAESLRIFPGPFGPFRSLHGRFLVYNEYGEMVYELVNPAGEDLGVVNYLDLPSLSLSA
jgi:hypothetical protein